MKIKIKIYLLVATLLSIQTAFSQTNVSDSIRLDEVVVTGSKTQISRKIIPLSVSQITQKNIENSGQLNILSALNQFSPGIFVTERNIFGFGVSTGGSGAITMRGIGGNPNTEVLVLIDGHPQYQGIFGHPLADAYVSSDVEKVEIIHGPASILYGSNAMAGVVNIITKKQKNNGLSGNVGNSYGSYNTQKYYGTVGFKKDKLNAFASANYSSTDGIRENTDFKIGNGYLKLGYDIDDHLSVTIDGDVAKYNGNDNGKITSPALFNIDILRGKAAVSFDNRYKNFEGSFKIYHNFGEHILSDGFHSTDYNSGLMLYQSFRLFKGNLLTVGTDIKNYGGQANSGVNRDTLLTVTEAGVYVYTQQKIIDKLNVTAGLRSEFHPVYGSEIIPMAGINFNLNDNSTLKANFSKGFRSPTLMELYLYAPNPDLEPEKLYSYEIGWLQSSLNNKLNLELNTYYIDAKNLIQVVGGTIPKRQNVGAVTNYGLEFSGKYAVNDNLFLHANYSYLHTSIPILAAPEHQFNVSANYRYKIWNVNIGIQQINGLYSKTTAIAEIQDYTLLNLRVSAHPIKHLELYVMGNNLLNQQYEINDGYPMPGINFNGGLKLSF
jgi:outer membrane cobalamin receptor